MGWRMLDCDDYEMYLLISYTDAEGRCAFVIFK